MKGVLLGVGLVLLAACAGQTADGPTPLPTSGVPLTESKLKYRLMDSFGELFFCDPDFYPVARADEADLARQRFPEIQAQTEEFEVILFRLGLAERARAGFTDAEVLAIYREHKRLAAILLEPAGAGYRFQLRVGLEDIQVTAIEGEIDRSGAIRVTARTPGQGMCPICLSEAARIDGPGGPVAVADLRSGDLVWSLTRGGSRIAVPVLRVGSTASPAGHIMVRLTLRDGRVVLASPGHPTADGVPISTLVAGDSIDGSVIVLVERVPYSGSATHDLLPASDTGVYWADGVLLGSTLKP